MNTALFFEELCMLISTLLLLRVSLSLSAFDLKVGLKFGTFLRKWLGTNWFICTLIVCNYDCAATIKDSVISLMICPQDIGSKIIPNIEINVVFALQ